MKTFFRVLRKLGLIQYLNINTSVIINQKEYSIPVLGGIGMVNVLNKREDWMITILDRLTNKIGFNQNFIDVGVNLGQTLLKVKSVNKNIPYVGIEPNPFCIHYLNKLISQNQFKGVEILPVGVSDKTGITKLNFFSDSEVGPSASIMEDFRSETETVKKFNVPVFNFSEISILGEKSILKIDVEGAELEVLNGLFETIKKNQPIILLEILPNYNGELKERVSRQNEIERFINEIEYSIFRIIRKDEEFLDLKKLHDFGLHADLSLCDYIICPDSMQEEVMYVFQKN